jgi:cytochrome c oxidase subunit 3
MSTFVPPVAVERPKSGEGGGGVHPPAFGGGDGGPGDGSPDYEHRLQRARLALFCGVASISILFITVTTVFFALRHGTVVFDPHTNRYVRTWVAVVLPVRLLLLNTLVLLLSSVTIEMARRRSAREMVLAPIRSLPGIALDQERGVPWVAMTLILGLLFLTGQWLAWTAFRAEGFHVSAGSPTPFFYLLTGAHAIHLIGGMLVLFYAGAASLLHRALERRRIILEVAAWYWHFMGLLWVYIFALLQFGR